MCRLALLNREAILFLEHDLDTLFCHLEKRLGGDGNGIGLLWQETGYIKVRKGLHFRAMHAAGALRFAAHQGADWGLFHTRMATSGGVCTRTCHPFKHGHLVLAHNGHNDPFARLGALTRKVRSDSEALAQYWARYHSPISMLANWRGVFIGFHHNQPFVVKGQPARDLVLAWHEKSGAMLFVSELPGKMRQRFDLCIDVGRLVWQGEMLDFTKIDRRPVSEPKKAVAMISVGMTVPPLPTSPLSPEATPLLA